MVRYSGLFPTKFDVAIISAVLKIMYLEFSGQHDPDDIESSRKGFENEGQSMDQRPDSVTLYTFQQRLRLIRIEKL